MKPLAFILLVSFAVGLAGCGSKVDPADRAAIDAALAAYWQARDAQAKTRVKTVKIEGDKASITFSLTFPEFHSIATTRTGELINRGGKWEVVQVSE